MEKGRGEEGKRGRGEMSEPVKTPWGKWQVLVEGEGFKVKLLEINLGQRTSLQSHQEREEWLFLLEGWGTIELEGQKEHWEPGERFVIKKGAKHRLKCYSSSPLRILEVQWGSVLTEKDIIRYEDDYGRQTSSVPSFSQ